MSPTPPDKIAERTLAADLGLSRETLLAWRTTELQEGRHWVRVGRDVRYLGEGVEAVRGLLQRDLAKSAETALPQPQAPDPTADTPSPAIELPAPALDPRSDLLTVVSLPRNPRLVLARTLAGALVRVRVRSSEHFVPGMQLRAQQEAGDVWCLIGRCPRWKGRW